MDTATCCSYYHHQAKLTYPPWMISASSTRTLKKENPVVNHRMNFSKSTVYCLSRSFPLPVQEPHLRKAFTWQQHATPSKLQQLTFAYLPICINRRFQQCLLMFFFLRQGCGVDRSLSQCRNGCLPRLSSAGTRQAKAHCRAPESMLDFSVSLLVDTEAASLVDLRAR